MSIVDDLDQIKREARDEAEELYGPGLEFLRNLRATVDLAERAIRESVLLRRERDFWQKQHSDSVDRAIETSSSASASLLKAALEGVFAPRATDDREKR